MYQTNKTSLKKTKIPWIGEIPEGWEVRRLKYLTPDNRYYPIGDGDHGAIKPDMYKDNGIPYFRVQNLTWTGEISYDGMVYISLETHKNNPKSILYPNDILIAKTGATIGKLCLIPSNIPEANTTSSVGKISIDHQKHNVRFILYAMMNPYFKNQYELDAYEKSAQPGFNIEDLINYVLLIPPLSTQTTIAHFLDQKTEEISTLISNKKRLILLLKEQKQSIIHRAVTKGVNKNAKMKDSGIPWIGEIPEDWKIWKMKKVCYITDGTHDTPKYLETDTGFALITTKDIKKGEISFDDCKYISEQDYISINKRSNVENNDIIMPMIGTIGGCAIVNTDRKFSVKNVAIFKTSISEQVETKYLAYVLDSEIVKTQFDINSKGNVQDFVSQEIIKQLQIPLPSLVLQRNIIEHIEQETAKIDNAIEKIEKELTLIEEYRTSLIYQSVTGKINIL